MNWHSIISDLQQRGLSLAQIARKCGCAQSSISDLKGRRTQEPAFPVGAALVQLSKASDSQIKKIKREAALAALDAGA